MIPDPKALAVLLDAARGCYGDDSEQVRWLLNPEAVRELLRRGDYDYAEIEPGGEDWIAYHCNDCGAEEGETHNTTVTATDDKGGPSDIRRVRCRIAAAWRALGDPRGAADIERAQKEALREQERRTDPLTDAQRLRRGIRRISDERGAAHVEEEARMAHRNGRWRSGLWPRYPSEPRGWWLVPSRAMSDARGMEAVEAEARRYADDWYANRPDLDRSVGREPFVP